MGNDSRQGEFTRRDFLRTTGGIVLGISFLGVAGCEFNSVEPIALGKEVPFLTPVDEFYYKNGADISIRDWTLPVLPQNQWELKIDGLVSTPTTVRFADLEAESAQTINLLKTMRCVIDSNEVQGLIGTAVWRGVPLRTFLDRAGVNLAATKRLRLYGADGFTNNMLIERVYGNQPTDLVEPILVTHMNGTPLTAEHGAPVRLIIHESFGYKNVKWITRVEATDADTPFGTYQDAGFADDGVIRTVSRPTEPLANAQVPAGLVTVRGFAVSGVAGVADVAISVDGGIFSPATLQDQESVLGADPLIAEAIQFAEAGTFPFPFQGVWRKWEYTFDATPGAHTIRIKATDGAGNAQPESDSDISDGINAIPLLAITAQ